MSFFRTAGGAKGATRWLGVAGLMLGGWLSAALRAETVLSVPTGLGGDVTIKVAMPTAQPPRFGFAAVRVSIENSAPQDRTWQFQFQSGARGQYPGLSAYERAISVPAGQTRETWVYVPVAEMGTPGGAPNFASPPPAASYSGTAAPTVSVMKVPGGTKILRTWALGGSGRIYRSEETTINETTGELTIVSGSGVGAIGSGASTTRTTRPPPGNDIIYTVDPTTGDLRTQYFRATGSGPVKVTVIHGALRGGLATAPTPTTTPQATNVVIEKTTVGMKVTRVLSQGSGPSPVKLKEEREIDTTTGVITSTTYSPTGTRMSSRSTSPAPLGSEVTHSINSTDGTISTSTRTGANPAAPPRIVVVTVQGAAGGGAGVRPRIYPSPYNGPAMTLIVEAAGPGIVGKGSVSFSALGSAANMRPIAATQAIERVLRESFNKEGISTPNLSVVDPGTLPADWRLWSGFAYVYLGTDEYVSLDGARRAALRAWVAFGGQLILVPGDEGEKVTERVGGGTIMTLAKPIKEAILGTEWNDRGLSVGGTLGYPDQSSLSVSGASLLGTAVAEREPDTSWLTAFIVIFAAVVGPVNLFLFAPAGRRHRLFFTTPLISLGAAVALGATIFVQDGAGGTGLRRTIILLIPGDNQAAIVQEQTSRTGFIARQSFKLPDDTQLTSLALQDASLGNIGNFAGAPALLRDDAQASGNWFGSRGRQGFLLQRLVPTRGRVERVGTAADGAPIVQSSLGGTLRDFVLADGKGKTWSARELVPGKRTTLTEGGVWIGAFPLGGTDRFGQLFGAAAATSPGQWGGKADDGELGPLATHGSVKWQKGDVIYLGRIEGPLAAATEVKP